LFATDCIFSVNKDYHNSNVAAEVEG